MVTRLDEYLNTFSYHWNVARACDAGLSRRGLEYLAARDPNWGDGRDAAYVAVKNNYPHVLQWLSERYPDRTSWGSLQARCFINTAARRGHFAILKWLHTNCKEGCCDGSDVAELLEHKLKLDRQCKSSSNYRQSSWSSPFTSDTLFNGIFQLKTFSARNGSLPRVDIGVGCLPRVFALM